MSDTIIQVRGLGKQYRIGVRENTPSSKRGIVWNAVQSPFRYLQEMSRPPTEEETLWALRDVSFDVRRGEVLGLIGRNGAGKSTMLKVLSRITDPTTGRAVIKGRIGSLLEVGTGFHPDLTGRENIYLSGTILGMRKGEIDRKFDEIVAFSDISRFLDTPVKRYSSGMYVRLAFAVAAHLEPEVLLVDEVLAVGDLAFQRKCLGKMETISHKDGRTVIFVSHNMQSIRDLCPRSLLLQGGRVVKDGATSAVQAAYYEEMRKTEVNTETSVNDTRYRRGSGAVRYSGIRVEDAAGNQTYDFQMGDAIRFVLSYHVFQPVDELYSSIVIRSAKTGEVVTSATNLLSATPLRAGYKGTSVIELPNNNIRPGEYPISFWLGNHLVQPYDVVEELTLPLILSTDKEFEDVGFNPTFPIGFYSINSTVVSQTENG